jgi:precorrin-6B methylase 2
MPGYLHTHPKRETETSYDKSEGFGYNGAGRRFAGGCLGLVQARMNQQIWQMTRTVAALAAILTPGTLLTSCRSNYKNTPPSLMFVEEKKADRPATNETALRSGNQAEPPASREPAALFIAYVATPPDVVARMLKLARVTRKDVVYDLGCGDGRIVVTAAKKYGCRAVGYDLDPLRVQEARANAERSRVARRVTIEQQDILKGDFQQATVVTLYLGTEMNARLIPQLRKLKPGTRVVSHDFGLEKIPPDKVVEMTSRDDGRKHTLYLWTCPLAASDN